MGELSFALATGLTIKLYALLTPTAVLTAFIALTGELDKAQKRRIAFKTGLAIYLIGEFLLVFGAALFDLFGFTLDAFRIGVGLLLFLQTIQIMNEDPEATHARADPNISVVPLAVPLGMGPATIGTVVVLGASRSSFSDLLTSSLCLLISAAGISALLFSADSVCRLLGRTGILVMAKLTALILSAIAAQVIFTGIKAFF